MVIGMGIERFEAFLRRVGVLRISVVEGRFSGFLSSKLWHKSYNNS